MIIWLIIPIIFVLLWLFSYISNITDNLNRVEVLKKHKYEDKSKLLDTQLKEVENLKIVLKKESEFKKETLNEEYKKKKEELEKLIDYYKKCITDIDKMIEKKCDVYPSLAIAMADILTIFYTKSAIYLENKPHPAITEATRIRELKKQTQAIIKEKKELEYKLKYIYTLYPEIDTIFDKGFNEARDINLEELKENFDKVSFYLSKEEYTSLSIVERNQLALDRYIRRNKSNWELGRDYELYIGYLYESQGYKVEYNGIIKKLEDMGRDLIATKDFDVEIIQCKNWSKEKEIHEKHIFQLYGTFLLYLIEHPLENVSATFITSTHLSRTAKKVAKHLGIKVIENKMFKEFPRIKCNINKTTGERIYHLPFDQQYETTIVDVSKGEKYCLTVLDAEKDGYRRARKYFSQKE